MSIFSVRCYKSQRDGITNWRSSKGVIVFMLPHVILYLDGLGCHGLWM